MKHSMELPQVGQRVRWKKRDEGDAGMFVPEGATGTIQEVEEEVKGYEGRDGQVRILIALDEPYKANGCDDGWSYYPECEAFEPHPLGAFWDYCEII